MLAVPRTVNFRVYVFIYSQLFVEVQTVFPQSIVLKPYGIRSE